MLRQDSTKRYNQLAVDLLKKILNRHYLPGSKLPSTRELAKQAGVNPNTMQRALQVLQDEKNSHLSIKKAKQLTRTITPMNMNTHIISMS